MMPAGDPFSWTAEQLEVAIVVALRRGMFDQAHWFAQELVERDTAHGSAVLLAIQTGTQFANQTLTSAVAFDFDGVIHRYSGGWRDGSIYDPPIPGSLVGLWAVTQLAPAFIHTSREPEQVGPWLEARGFNVTIDDRDLTFWTVRDQLLVTNRKLPARWYVDDRGLPFTSWPQTLGVLVAPDRIG